MSSLRTGKLDFHLHSYASNVTDYYASNSLAIPESYSDPLETYQLLKSRGMQLVTLTDHNSIDGVKELLDAGLPDVFISSEMTASFPEDGCNIHVTVANVTEAQFAEVDRLRSNLYEMIDYLDQQIATEDERNAPNKIAYFMTHPLMSTQNRPYGREGSLQLTHIEKALLLCNCLEVRNGTRTRSLNSVTRLLVESLTRATIERLADRHGIAPKGPEPWRKAQVAGSDDHSGINPGRTWTEFVYRGEHPAANDVIESIRGRTTRPGGGHGGPVTLAHAVVKLLYDGQFSQHKSSDTKSISMGGPINRLLSLAFDSKPTPRYAKFLLRLRATIGAQLEARSRRRRCGDRAFEKILADEACALLSEPEFEARLARLGVDEKIFTVISELTNRIFVRYAMRIREAGSTSLIRMIKECVALVSSNLFVSLPYFLSYSHQSSDRLLVRDVRKGFQLGEPEKLVLVTDTLFEVNGVARTIRKIIREAQRRSIDLTVVTCSSASELEVQLEDPEIRALVDSGRLKIFGSILDVNIPEYDGLKVRVLPFLEFMKYCQEQGFTKMQISTPGTVGVAGLLAAKILQIETSSTYHTSFPEYVENYTGDISLEAFTWKCMVMFYHSVDEVVVPSRFVARLLHKRGLRKRKLLVLDRWVDLDQFHPHKHETGYWRAHGVPSPQARVKFVYVGRLGVEKNLDVLAEAFRELARLHADAHLIVIGDGPFRAELEGRLAGLPATFTGFLEGAELETALASCDVKVFPSTTDTWGNAPLEAQAAGLPVIVTDKGGPQELIEEGVTGLKTIGGSVPSLLAAMTRLMDAETRATMGRAARRFVEERHIEDPYSAILSSGKYRKAARATQERFVVRPVEFESLEALDPDLNEHATLTPWTSPVGEAG